MKKIVKIVLYNVLVFVILLILSEVFSFLFLYNKYNYEFFPLQSGIFKNYVKMRNPEQTDLISNLRPVEYRNQTKRPIVIFGCSFAWGHNLPENLTFSRKLADKTGRTVINRAKYSEGTAFMYYQLANKNIIKEIKALLIHPNIKNYGKINDDVEYVIYVNIPDHAVRNHRHRYNTNNPVFRIRYQLKDGKLVQNKVLFPLIHSLYTAALIEKIIDNTEINNLNYENTTIYEEMILESAVLIHKEFKNAVFAVILMPDFQENSEDDDTKRPQLIMWKRIQEKLGSDKIILIDMQKELPLAEDKYWNANHPTAQAWDEIIPVIMKKLNL